MSALELYEMLSKHTGEELADMMVYGFHEEYQHICLANMSIDNDGDLIFDIDL